MAKQIILFISPISCNYNTQYNKQWLCLTLKYSENLDLNNDLVLPVWVLSELGLLNVHAQVLTGTFAV